MLLVYLVTTGRNTTKPENNTTKPIPNTIQTDQLAMTKVHWFDPSIVHQELAPIYAQFERVKAFPLVTAVRYIGNAYLGNFPSANRSASDGAAASTYSHPSLPGIQFAREIFREHTPYPDFSKCLRQDLTHHPLNLAHKQQLTY